MDWPRDERLFTKYRSMDLTRLNAEQAQLNVRLLVNLTPAELAESGKRLKAIESELADREERWLELSETLQSLAA